MTEQAIHVEVAYAKQDQQKTIAVKLPAGSTVEEAIRKSGILAEFPEIDLAVNKIGIYSKACKLDTALRDKDRVEIYRPLIADPKEVRKQRAAEGKPMKKGSGMQEA
ncbi:hypothetical protein SAMN05660284_01215 [Formivibrio citricus]|uniref:UPF0125 protein SAMN05660284_01215 n=1 Tax=Formivibrio citricus TaxID=83765 RepID=A0A1I4Y4K8_9NEIS|nr:RnfH family protein [Formivibrio citricus]SFN32996.1 hypothetical protein SAMN05660284_01215 [Formivibrio citricus]